VTFHVQFTREAQEDLERLSGFIIERELASATGDLDIARSKCDHKFAQKRAVAGLSGRSLTGVYPIWYNYRM